MIMKKLKIKKGDTVYVNAGNDKGKTGKVLSVLKSEDRVIIEGINLVSKHTKPNSKQPQGGIIKQEAPIHISNVNLLDPASTAAKPVPTRVGYKFEGDKKIRVSKKSGQEIKKLWQRKLPTSLQRHRFCPQDTYLPSRRSIKRKSWRSS